MSQYFTDFSEYTVGDPPSDWSLAIGSSAAATVVDGGATYGNVLQISTSTFDLRRCFVWDNVPNSADVEILCLMRETSDGDPAVSCRVVAVDSDYIVAGQFDNGTRHREYDNDTEVGGSFDGTNHETAWVWVKVQVSGTAIKIKTWTDGSTEPTWITEDVIVSVTAPGRVGLFLFTNGEVAEVSQFSVGTGGDSAPTSAGPSLTVTQATLTPGGTISGTYSNYTTIPTTLTVSDGTNTIGSDTGEITGLVINDNGDGSGDWTATMPALPTTGTANLVLFGDVTVELT